MRFSVYFALTLADWCFIAFPCLRTNHGWQSVTGDESSVSDEARFEGPDHGNGDGGCPLDGFGSDSSRSSAFLCFESYLRFGGFSFECCQHKVFFDFLEVF